MEALKQLLTNERVCNSCQVRSKKASLEVGAELIATSVAQLEARELLDDLLNRERLGSTALGNGIAIPHCRSEKCIIPSAALIHLEESVDFDGDPVDILMVLVVPKEETTKHLEILAALAHLFDHASNLQKLRASRSSEELFHAFVNLTEHALVQ